MNRRIFGIETEYGLVAGPDPTNDAPPAATAERLTTLAQALIPRDPHWRGGNHGRWLPNGGLAYVDLGAHPETATPECLTPTEAVAHDTAAMLWLNQRRIELAEKGVAVSIFRNTGNPQGTNSWGIHENYLTSRHDIGPARDAAMLAIHIGTRHTLFGSGRYYLNADTGTIEHTLAARAAFTDMLDGGSTTGTRPLINIRDEPHSDRSRWRRLHITSSDSYLDRAALRLQLASTHLFLRLAEEHRDVLDNLVAVDPRAAFVHSSTHPDAVHECVDGQFRSCLDIQEALAQLCATHLDPTDDPNVEQIPTWIDWIDRARQGTERLDRRAPWAAKRILGDQLIERLTSRGVSVDDQLERLQAFEAMWANIDPNVGFWWRGGIDADELADELEHAAKVADTPPATRAAARMAFHRRAAELRIAYRMSWYCWGPDSKPVTIANDPFDSTSD